MQYAWIDQTENGACGEICDDRDPEKQLLARFVGFAKSLFSSANEIVQTCFSVALNGSRSSIGKTLLPVCKKARCARDAVVSGDPARLFSRDPAMAAEGSLVRDLLVLRHETLVFKADIFPFVIEEITHMIEFVWQWDTMESELNITSTMNDTQHQAFYTNAQFITGLVCYPIICFVGMTGNIFILIVLGQKAMQTSTNVFLSALAISDIIKLVNDFLYFLTVLLQETHPSAGNKAFGYLYPYAHFIFNMSVCVSSWLTVSVAVERYILVCHPTRAKGITSIPRAKVISIVCFIWMTAIAIPSALRYKTVTITVQSGDRNISSLDVKLTPLWLNETFVVAYNWLQSLLRSIIPLFVLVFTSSFIINALRKTRANKRMASRNKITLMLIIVILSFLVCIIPDAIMSAFFNLGYAESENYLVKGVREITDMLLGVNAMINFELYMIFNKLFRDQFMQLFCKKFATKPEKDAQYQPLAEKATQHNGSFIMMTESKL
ncbi:hypothetical protein CAPTEDRAFT_200662 [Capitella teleta]|uniref:G-protein coupled receptors family 1 profile domain-containing protein n=1 Tax=Capitella teleta TaxID=283909 RepID=R7U1Q5_CAPTE|nr:hypothetical protein CAPTEDRAFT_200662 [Capitella teleta]|eukprot:ELU00159.1 hypothetical protein CAPTEDRAFT_200662 [Capitella teleta]